jgi:Alpha/beta hydrolase of unknown function (DUF900)
VANALSVRPRRLSETPVSNEVYVLDGSVRDLNSARRLVILIHGYNNSETQAGTSFDAFRESLRDAIPRHELWEFHWPGDHPKRLTALLTYPGRAAVAPEVGARLGSFVRKHPSGSIAIVAHSLGCRVALETARAIGSAESGLREVFLLAAAVPVPLCATPLGRFPRPLPSSREHVFFSRRDRALGRAFERGQEAINEYERGPAVGRTGDPGPSRWTAPLNTNLRHRQYWASQKVADEIMQRLGIPTVRRLSGRYLAQEGEDTTTWSLERFSVAKRKLNRR